MAIDIKIQAFTRVMNGQLAANQGRGGWRGREFQEVVAEVRVLLDALEKKVQDDSPVPSESTLDEQRAEIVALAADIANNVMFIADNCNALRYDGLGELK